uniref:STAS domain-containing protein n=1 Tax=Proboscia inermis TaxID=420281 RepID=A0A7S0GLA6_9STRA|mmetsp:Transcript_7424/g.7612  ORF Transcript_7424/g.7612 Transcript_7424/m.7612 type:complete len:493 (+) Transcript_7424:306-1784(+)
MGVLRLGFVAIILSHAVVSGFTTGAAVMIGMSQVKYILGYDVARSSFLHELIVNIFKDIDQFNYKPFILGMSNIIALVGLKNIGKTYPKFKSVRALGPLLVSSLSILATFIFDLENNGIDIIGTIPSGLPSLSTDIWFPVIEFNKLISVVISVAIVGFMESIAIAKQLATKHHYELDSSQELIGLGMANILGAMFFSYPVTGSFSRSAVNDSSGAESGISGMITATLVMIVLLFLTSVFEYIPSATLAAIVISGVLGLLDHAEAIFLWKVHKRDFSVWMISFLGTMFLGVEVGLLIAVGVSILLVMYESAYPHTAMLGRLPGTTVYRNVKQYPKAEMYEGIMLCRIDAPIYFANTQHIREKISKYEKMAIHGHASTKDKLLSADSSCVFAIEHPINFIIIDMSPVSYIDSSAIHVLGDMNDSYKKNKVQLCLCNPSTDVMAKLVVSGLAKAIGEDYIFVCMHDAVNGCLIELGTMEEEGSLRSLVDGKEHKL